MFTVTLGDKTYKVEKVSVRALAGLDEAWDLYRRLIQAVGGEQIEGDATTFKQAIDALVRWFVLFCGDQFTADEVYDHYPADRIVADVALAMQAVVGRVTEELKHFPMSAGPEKEEQPPTGTSPIGFMTRIWKRAGRRRK